jgi:hypothetical protein
MFKVDFRVGGWSYEPELDYVLLSGLVSGLAKVNRVLIERGGIPPLYGSGVVYVADPRGGQVWRDCVAIMQRGSADCKSLVAWRLAELEIAGVRADVALDWVTNRRGYRTYHVWLRTANGEEDPSRLLGMP